MRTMPGLIRQEMSGKQTVCLRKENGAQLMVLAPNAIVPCNSPVLT